MDRGRQDGEDGLKTTVVGIVGGGSVAAAYLHHLVTALAAGRLAAPVRVLVFEPQPRIGRGRAYADDLPSNLLNVTVAAMSVAGDDKTHFQRWLAAQGITQFAGRPVTASSFVSRALFGAYLEAVTRDNLQQARALDVQVEHVAAEVTRLRPAPGGGQLLTTADGRQFNTDRLVLTLGNLPSTTFPALRGHPGYADSPYPTTTLCSLPPHASVCIVGTSLSAVDAIVALAASGHRGPIHAVSRNGRLPCVRSLHNKPLQLQPAFKAWVQQCCNAGRPVPLDVLVARVKDEFAVLAGGSQEDLAALALQLPDAATFLDNEIDVATTQPRLWQTFGNILNDCIDALWQLLDDGDRQRFEREIRPLWMSRRVSFPLENAQTLRRLMQAGRLHVRGGFETATARPGAAGFAVALRAHGSHEANVLQVDALINATSFSTSAAQADVPLLQDLLQQGAAAVHRFGGLQADFNTGCLVDATGRIDPHITVLGSMVAGTYFWTNAMEVNARIAMGQAQRLVASLQGAAADPDKTLCSPQAARSDL